MGGEQTPTPTALARHAGCPICADQTRPGAYDWIGKQHWIPGIHGANWLGDDLRQTLARLPPGQEAELDYRSSVDGAPRIAVRRSLDDVITAQAPDGWSDADGSTRWVWPPEADPVARIERITVSLLRYIVASRGGPGVVIVE